MTENTLRRDEEERGRVRGRDDCSLAVVGCRAGTEAPTTFKVVFIFLQIKV